MTIILGCVLGLIAGVGVYFRERRVGQGLRTGLALAGLTAGTVLGLSHWRARSAMIEVSAKPARRTFLSSMDGAVSRVGAFYAVVLETDLGAQRRKLPVGRAQVVRHQDAVKPHVETLLTRVAADPDYNPSPWLLRLVPGECDGEPRYVIHVRPGTRIEGEIDQAADVVPMADASTEAPKQSAREAELKAKLAAAYWEAEKARAEARRAQAMTPEEREAATRAYEEQKARALAAQEVERKAEEEAIALALREEAEEVAALEGVLEEAKLALGRRNYARAYVLAEQLRSTEDWPQSETLRMGVTEIDTILADYQRRMQQQAAKAAWLAQVRAQQEELARQRSEQQQAAVAAQGSGAPATPLARALGQALSNRRRYCRECGEWFTESRRAHERHCRGYRLD